MDQLPAINASLNGLSTGLLLMGFGFIRRKQVAAHRLCMIAAFVLSMLFLVGYVLHKVNLHAVTGSYNTVFSGTGWARTLYFFILIPHVVLAMLLPLLTPPTLFLGLKMNVKTHRKLAHITLPIWLYVSVSGVFIYFMLYHWYPAV